MSSNDSDGPLLGSVAIIGMAGRFPGAGSVAEFWRNQLAGVESISQFKVEELEVTNAAELAKRPDYVRARSILEDVDLFDPEFFGIYPREAELMDPQHRLFLESCWEAFEDAGYDPFAYPGAVGVYAGASMPTYFISKLCSNGEFIKRFTGGYQVGNYPEMMGNSPDFLATRVSYKFNLRGPSFTLQAGCSTSLVAVCQACQALLTYQCDMALAGGSSITFPQKRGSIYQEGGMISPDGHCRTFDAEAQGTVFGSGVGVVMLKRLDDAVSAGDQVYAVIRGFSLNNDGAAKVGYTAPSVEGQAQVIAMAQQIAGVHPETIGYIEAHGTGTPLGDPIELAALTQAFRSRTKAKQFCALGTAKTSVGHLDVAAGVTGLIRAAHIVRDGKIPPTLHFQKPNPKFDLESSPFFVNSKLTDWETHGRPRRAGVSAFGVGGTNAHVVLEQAPEQEVTSSRRLAQLLPLSARSEAALGRAADNLAGRLQTNPEMNIADTAWTLQEGRREFEWRRFVVAGNVPDAITALQYRDARAAIIHRPSGSAKPLVCFLFPGQASQRVNMARELFETEPVFRHAFESCAAILRPHLDADLRDLIYPDGGDSDDANRRVTETAVAQPAIFTVSYATARLWMSWGIHPDAMLGHSIGEFVAACLAGSISLEDVLNLVAARGRLMQQLPPGGMLSVRLAEDEIRHRINGTLALAAVNAPSLCVVAGPFADLEAFESKLNQERIACRRLATSHAFHSAMMDPILEPFAAHVEKARFSPPKIPWVSTVTGTWITENQAIDPTYWAHHFRQTVQFSKALGELARSGNEILLEVGPGTVLTTLAKQHPQLTAGRTVVASLNEDPNGAGGARSMLAAAGTLWAAGARLDWPAMHTGERRRRVSLPTYPFERKRCWLETDSREMKSDSPLVGRMASEVQQDRTDRPREETKQVNVNGHAPSSQQLNPRTRNARISTMLAESFEELSGIPISGENEETTFLEMGFDSLFLTQVTQALQSKFNVKITFRQLLGDLSSLKALTEYIEAKLPADFMADTQETEVAETAETQTAQAAPAPVALVQDASASASRVADSNRSLADSNGNSLSDASSLERLMREQLQAMNQLFTTQLETLRGTGQPSTKANSTRAMVPAPIPTSPAKAAGSDSPAAAPVATTSERNSAKPEFKPFGPYKPPQRGTAAELTKRQQNHLVNFIAQYSKRTSKSKNMTQEYRTPLADPRVVSGFRAQWKEIVYPIVTERSKGSRLWDIDGNEYVDILNGFGPIMLGHRPGFVEQAIEKQLREGFEIGPQTPLAGEVAKMFCEMTGNERMTYCNTGSEAVIAALRVARTVTGRSKVVLFAGSYHGMFDEVLVKGIKRSGGPHAVPVAPGIPRESVSNVTVLDYGTAESLEYIRSHANELAAVLVEAVQSRHPNLQPREFLHEIRKITQESGAALVFDEVVTGFRVHPGGCQALFGIRADLATYGKVLAGGMPIGVLAGKAEFMDALDGGAWQFGDESYPSVGVTFFAGTFVRHPLTLAAVKAVLTHFRNEGPQLQERLSARTAELVASLNEMLERNNVPTRIESFASIFYFSFPTDFPFGSLFYYYLREKGVYLLEGFPCFLTTAHSDADIELIKKAFRESIAEMQAGGLFPEPAELPSSRDRDAPMVEAPASTAALADGGAAPQEAPMTEAQLEIWLSAQLSDEASCAFNESFTLHLRGNLHVQAFREALQSLVNRHEALRASFVSGSTQIRFAPNMQLDVAVEDLSSLDASGRKARLEATIQEEARKPFDLSSAPLVRARLLRLEPEHHALLFTSHHIICDGWSTNVLLDELGKLYSATVSRTNPKLPPALEFSDYAARQARSAAAGETATSEAYWLGQFQKPAPVLELPTDRPRAAIKSFAGSTFRKHIDANTYKRIKQAGSRQGCTLFATLLGGLAALLHRLTAQDDLVVGIPTAGQSLLDNPNLVGHCVNFLPIRIPVSDSQSAADLLKSLKRNVLDAYEHQDYTYGTLVRKLKLRRDPSRLPLVEVQFNLEKVGMGLNLSGLQAEVDPNPKAAVNFDLFVNVVESADGLLIDCDYNSDLFDRETIGRWMNHYETLLVSMATDAAQTVSRLPILSEAESRLMLVEWNASAAEFPRDKGVHELIEEQAARTPDRPAITYNGQTLTYAELDDRANRLANYLRKLGVAPGELVGIAVERSLEMIVGLLAIWKAGAAYVPLDPAYPRERLAFILEETSIPFLLTQAALVSELPVSDARLVCMDRDWVLIEGESATSPNIAAHSGSLAYVIYTSGSTGKPKGVEVTHRSVVNLLLSMRQRPGLTADDRLLAVTTLSFDIAALELYLPLITGAQIIVASREAAIDGRRLNKLITDSQVTIMQATPATWRLLLEAGWAGSSGLKILCGGEALSRELANELAERGELWNMYGPTETTIWSATSRVEKGAGPVTIGPPIDNTQFYVFDANLQPVPVGVPGELYIGGEGVARGYHKRADMTADRFVADPFTAHNDSRLYKTGDLVRYRRDGRLEFLGRLDNQVKVRGFRIELGEIESSLAQYPGIREVAAVARENEPGVKTLVAYIVAHEAAKPSQEDLRTWLASSLPDYMVPSIFVFLPELPHTPNGKVDRKALAALDLNDLREPRQAVAPRTATEEKLAAVCAEVLRLERVGVTDSLFDLGADSVHLFQIIARAARSEMNITPQQLLRLRSIAAIAAELDAHKFGNGFAKEHGPEILPVSRERYRLESVPDAV